MKISYDLDLPKSIPEIKCVEEYEVIKEFVNSEHKNVVFEYESSKKAKEMKGYVIALVMNEKIPVYAVVRGNKLYIERRKPRKAKGEL